MIRYIRKIFLKDNLIAEVNTHNGEYSTKDFNSENDLRFWKGYKNSPLVWGKTITFWPNKKYKSLSNYPGIKPYNGGKRILCFIIRKNIITIKFFNGGEYNTYLSEEEFENIFKYRSKDY